MWGKQAMSPLIATVLLIAFAVALGAMIMNWSAGAVSEEKTVSCEPLTIALQETICASGNDLTMIMRNDGDVKIDGVELVLNNKAEELDLTLRIKDSSMVATEKIERTTTAIVPNLDTTASLNPMLRNENGELVSCPKQGVTQNKLVSC